jgi:tight adherence protein B
MNPSAILDAPEASAVLVAILVAALLGPVVARARSRAVRRTLRGSDPRHRVVARAIERSKAVGARLTSRRRGRPDADSVAGWCDDLSRRVRAGSTLRDALMVTGSSSPALAAVIAEVRHRLERGASIDEALADLVRDDGHLALAVAVIVSAARLGGPSAQPLDRAAAALRLRSADGQERVAHSAQARMSAHVLTLVPLGFLALMLTVDADVRQATTTPTGAAIIAVGLALNGIGWLWMRWVIGRTP